MNVLLSIKPKYVEAIINGQKTYAFRKVIFKKNQVNIVYIYSTSPIKKIVGAFRIGDIIEDRPEDLWKRLNGVSGMDKQDFFNYFENTERGFAIEIKNVEKFEDPLDPTEAIPNFVPPQSFRYINYSMHLGSSICWDKNRRLDDY